MKLEKESFTKHNTKRKPASPKINKKTTKVAA
jgi:hypothetical protein